VGGVGDSGEQERNALSGPGLKKLRVRLGDGPSSVVEKSVSQNNQFQ